MGLGRYRRPNYYKAFISGVGGSQWMSSQTQYGEPNAPYMGNQTGSYVVSWSDTADAVPTRTLNSRNYQSAIASEAQKAAAHFGDYSQPNSGWLDSGNAEDGDKCAWTHLQNTSFSSGTFPTQPLWSNSANGCVQ